MKDIIIKKIKNNESLDEYFETLEGSEKQIKWAESLRREALQAAINDVKESIEDGEGYEEFLDEDVKTVIEVLKEKDASEIISWRED